MIEDRPIEVTAVIVSYESATVLAACLDSLRREGVAHIIVVDNASTDGSARVASVWPGVTVFQNQTNLGFAAAANLGFRACGTPYVLLLNPDVTLLAGLENLIQEMENPRVGIAGGLLGSTEGAPQTGFLLRRFPTALSQSFEVLGINAIWRNNPVNRRYRCLDLDPLAAHEAQQPPGAMLLVRRQAWEVVGGFDEAFYPVWFEDVDFCQRVAAAGYSIRYNPACRARHHGGHSFRSMPWDWRQKYWYANLLRHASKHFGVAAFRALCVAVGIGALARMVAEGISRFRLEATPVFASVIQSAFRSLLRGRHV